MPLFYGSDEFNAHSEGPEETEDQCDILQHARSLCRGIVRHTPTEPTGGLSHTDGYQRLISQFDVHLLQKM